MGNMPDNSGILLAPCLVVGYITSDVGNKDTTTKGETMKTEPIEHVNSRNHSDPNHAFRAAECKLREVARALHQLSASRFGTLDYPTDQSRQWDEVGTACHIVNDLVDTVNEANGFVQ